ncbi:hypothetical protein BRC62_01645 [Halobacteriales archaeon QH_10_67_13]|nr:MAG: hypothetical protein BRC62_01645 [Halobacteriales archaeon QH_10_67_13]
MTERTDELRDLFRSVTGTEEVTDEQELSDGDAPDPEERLAAIVGKMRERYEFATDRPTETYVRIVRLYHEGRRPVKADDRARARERTQRGDRRRRGRRRLLSCGLFEANVLADVERQPAAVARKKQEV